MLSAMRRLALCLLAPFLFLACPGTQQDLSIPKQDADNDPPDAAFETEPNAPQALKVMTFNCLNLFNDKLDSPGLPVAEDVQTPADYQLHLDRIATVFTQFDPDVAVLQEVENEAVVADLAQKLGKYPHTAITEGNDPRGIDIAILSKAPFQVAPSHKDEFFQASTDPTQTFVYARDVLEAHMIYNGRHVVFLGIHFKAETDPESQLKRLAEAEHTREIFTAVHYDDPSAAIIVLGDFNAAPGSPPIQALLGGPPLPFTSAGSFMPAADRWSVQFGGNLQLYDDQIMNQNALSMLDQTSVVIPHEGANDGSDHDPMIATYNVN
jgi:endonuclease/exonuclease/phosphatase family metal-dependent hydrolase